MAQPNLMTDAQTLWEIDPRHTRVEFTAKNFFGLHAVTGRFQQVRGSAQTTGDALDDASIEVEIAVSDLETGLNLRNKHLLDSHFFHAGSYPTMSFRSTRVDHLGGSRLRVQGELTLRGATRPVTLDAAIVQRNGEHARLAATTTLNRRDFGIMSPVPSVLLKEQVAVRVALALRAGVSR